MKAKSILVASVLMVGFLSGCGTTDMERRLEKNFVYQCSLQLFDKLDKKVTGADAEKICTAAHQSEMDEDARKNGLLVPTPTPANSTPAAAAPAPVKEVVKPSPADNDEIKPEPTPTSSAKK